MKERNISIISTRKLILEIVFLVAYILLVYIADIVEYSAITPFITHHFGVIAGLFTAPICKLLFWIIPAFLYIIYIEKRPPFIYLKLTTNVLKGVIWGCLISLLYVVVPFYKYFILRYTLHLNAGIDEWVNVVLLVGIIEEIPFRGLLFQKLQQLMDSWRASLLSSLLFLGVHIPYWISLGQVLFPNMLYTMAYLFIFAFVLCFILRRSGSLWSCIIIHSVNDLASLFH